MANQEATYHEEYIGKENTIMWHTKNVISYNREKLTITVHTTSGSNLKLLFSDEKRAEEYYVKYTTDFINYHKQFSS